MDRLTAPWPFRNLETDELAPAGITVTLTIQGSSTPLQTLDPVTLKPVPFRTGKFGMMPEVVVRGDGLKADTTRLIATDASGNRSTLRIGVDDSVIQTEDEVKSIARSVAIDELDTRNPVSAAALTKALETKADRTYVDEKIKGVNAGIVDTTGLLSETKAADTFATKTDLTNGLASKLNSATYTSGMATKADVTALSGKADHKYVDDAVARVASGGVALPAGAQLMTFFTAEADASAWIEEQKGAGNADATAFVLVDGGAAGGGEFTVGAVVFPALVVGTAIAPIQLTASLPVDEWIIDGLPAGLYVDGARIVGTPLVPMEGATSITARSGTEFTAPVTVSYTVTGASGGRLARLDWSVAGDKDPAPADVYQVGARSFTSVDVLPLDASITKVAQGTLATNAKTFTFPVTWSSGGKDYNRTGTYEPGLYLPRDDDEARPAVGVRREFPGIPGARTVRFKLGSGWPDTGSGTLYLWDGGPGKRVSVQFGNVQGKVNINSDAAGTTRTGAAFNMRNGSVLRARMGYDKAKNQSAVTITYEGAPESVTLTIPGDARGWGGFAIDFPNSWKTITCVQWVEFLAGDVA